MPATSQRPAKATLRLWVFFNIPVYSSISRLHANTSPPKEPWSPFPWVLLYHHLLLLPVRLLSFLLLLFPCGVSCIQADLKVLIFLSLPPEFWEYIPRLTTQLGSNPEHCACHASTLPTELGFCYCCCWWWCFKLRNQHSCIWILYPRTAVTEQVRGRGLDALIPGLDLLACKYPEGSKRSSRWTWGMDGWIGGRLLFLCLPLPPQVSCT